MNNIIKVAFTFLLILKLTSKSFCQPDFLQPVNGIFDLYNFELEYHLKIKRHLIQTVSGITELRFISLPAESVLIITRNEEFDLIHFRKPKNNIWYSQFNGNTDIEVIKYDKKIDKNSVAIIKRGYEAALRNMQVHDKESYRPDAGRIYFSVAAGVVRTGTTEYPREGTRMKELLLISYELIKMVKNPNIEVLRFDEKLIKRIEDLETQILESAK
ncbi:MAG: hypothetical protein CMO01_13930 [Thalassobius sp.]|nr:hypothetical protein [Thalassovita sp.]